MFVDAIASTNKPPPARHALFRSPVPLKRGTGGQAELDPRVPDPSLAAQRSAIAARTRNSWEAIRISVGSGFQVVNFAPAARGENEFRNYLTANEPTEAR